MLEKIWSLAKNDPIAHRRYFLNKTVSKGLAAGFVQIRVLRLTKKSKESPWHRTDLLKKWRRKMKRKST